MIPESKAWNERMLPEREPWNAGMVPESQARSAGRLSGFILLFTFVS